MLYIFGHKNPDTDSVVSAIGWAFFKEKKKEKAKAFRLGKLNEETKFALKEFKVPFPPLLKKSQNKKVCLVDHNEFQQSIDDIKSAKIVEIIDHHKINLSLNEPIFVLIKPYGSTSTIIAEIFFQEKIKISQSIAGILLCGILSDTLIFSSPTTTEIDKKIAKKLAKIAKIKDLKLLGEKLLEKKSEIKGSLKEILLKDSKLYEFSQKKVLISQIETLFPEKLISKKKEILKKMEEIKKEKKLFGFCLMITDISKNSTLLYIVSDDFSPFERAFGKIKNNEIYLKGVVSRKKQVVPPLEDAF